VQFKDQRYRRCCSQGGKRKYGECKKRLDEIILYTDELVLMSETMEELRKSLDDWKKAFESKGMNVNPCKTKLMVSGMKEGTQKIFIKDKGQSL